MKNQIKKFAAIFLSSTMILLNLGVMAYAGNPIPNASPSAANDTDATGIEFSKAFDGMPLCVSKEEEQGQYVITIIEEAIISDTSAKQNQDFEPRLCYRNTLQYTANNERTTIPVLLKDCSQKAQDLASQHATDDYKASFSCRQVQVILSKGGTTLLYGYIGMIYRWAASIVGVITVLIIILSGMQLAAAGGDPEAINGAKKRILQSLSGLAILFLSGLILYVINPNFFTI